MELYNSNVSVSNPNNVAAEKGIFYVLSSEYNSDSNKLEVSVRDYPLCVNITMTYNIKFSRDDITDFTTAYIISDEKNIISKTTDIFKHSIRIPDDKIAIIQSIPIILGNVGIEHAGDYKIEFLVDNKSFCFSNVFFKPL